MKLLRKMGFLASVLLVSNALQAQDTCMHDYEGRYSFDINGKVQEASVFLECNTLSISSEMGVVELKHMSADSFSIEKYDGHLVFSRDSAHAVVGVHVSISAGNIELDADKIRVDKETAAVPVKGNIVTRKDL